MKYPLITLASAVLPLAASAETTLYGILQGSLDQHSQSRSAGNRTLNDTGSRVGIKGTEPLANGQAITWQVESKVHLDGDADNEKSGLGTRETFVGVQDKVFGQLRLGYLNSALKDLYTIDQWQYSSHINHPLTKDEPHPSIGVNGLAVLSRPGKRLKNAIRYDFPTVNGLGGTLVYGFGENRNANSADTEITQASDILSLGINYHNGPGFISYAYEHEANPNGIKVDTKDSKKFTAQAQTGNSIKTAEIHYVEAGYKSDIWFLGLGYQQASGYDWTDGLSGSSATNFGDQSTPLSAAQVKLKTRQMAISAAYTSGAFTPKISLAKGWDKSISGHKLEHSGYRQFVAGVDYRISKRTTSGLSYGRLLFDQNAVSAFGERTKLASLGLNIKHSF